MERPDPSLARLTARLSRLLASGDGAATLSVLQRLGLLAARAPKSEATPAARRESLRFGIWQPQQREDGTVVFVRNEAMRNQWRFWAEVAEIRPKSGPRVVLLGESVARGYLYDPAVTPAAVLESMLRLAPALRNAEVVDLARSDLGMDELRTMLDLLPALEPDAIVLFAGNNWHTVPFAIEDLQDLADALRSEGYTALRRLVIERVVLPKVHMMLDEIAASVDPFAIPIALVIPEFNLRDWRSDGDTLAPYLPRDGNVVWLRTRGEAEAARAGSRWGELERLARSMIATDGGTSPTSQELLADALLEMGRPEEARAALEAARDAVFGLLIPHSPRCPTAVQDAMRAKAKDLGFAVVDLPRVLAERGALPDRRFFLDYCHLTIEGMRVAMGATARAVLRLLHEPGVPPDEFEALKIDVDARVESIAHLLAAIHNAHWGQRSEIVRHHARRAAELAPETHDLLLAYADVQSRRAEDWLCRSFDALTTPANVRRYLSVNESWLFEKLADFELVDAVVDALARHGIRAASAVEEILRSEHGREPRVDLLEPRYSATTFRWRSGQRGPGRAYHRALAPVSRFFLVREAPEPMRLRLTCRLASGTGPVGVSANGAELGAVDAESRWRSSEIPIPADCLRPGVNVIELSWPLCAPRSEELREADARRIERGVYPDVLPAFGEIHALQAVRGHAITAEGGGYSSGSFPVVSVQLMKLQRF